MRMNLNQFLGQSVAKRGAAVAWEWGDTSMTYAEFGERVDRIAAAVAAAGLRLGDRCAFLLHNRPEILELYFGLAARGVVAVPVNFRSVEREITHVLDDSSPRVLVFEEALLPVVAEVRDRTPDRTISYVIIGSGPRWAKRYDEWLAESAEYEPEQVIVEPDAPFFLAYTSGTTGAPKGAVITHAGLIRNNLSLMLEYGAASETRSRFLTLMPMFHSNSTWFATGCMMVGGTNIIHPTGKFDARDVLRTIADRHITHTSVVPTMLKMMADLGPDAVRGLDLSSLEWFLCGSAPISLALKREVESTFQVRVSEGYGSTETGLVSSLRMSDPDSKKASVGRATIGTEISVRDHEGRACGIGEVGDVWTRGETVLLTEYWKNPAATAKAFDEDRWLTVGDMGYLDEDGFLFLTDRKNDLIISGGENVYPSEVEGVLLTHPDIAEVAVVPLPDDHWGQVVRAVVALKPGHRLSAAEVVAHARAGLAGFKVPRVVDFVDALPKNSTGKILRRLVRDGAPISKERS